ncbi:MAG: carboxymuconolactone decarboxylase family protein [Burkholderiaceae bacterium]
MSHEGKSETWKRGYEVRCRTLGKEYVEKSVGGADDFTRDWQDFLNEHAWGASWARGGLEFKTRSMLNLAMLTALNRPHEFEIHLRGAINNGVSKDEVKEILIQAAVYCGAPAALDSFKVARRVFDELGI